MFDTPAPTAQRILDAAERLFAEQGYGPTSVRQITEMAGANVAAVNYHYGSKERLLRAVTDRIVHPLNEHRRRLLDDLRDQPAPATMRQLVEAFVRPDVEAMQRATSRPPVVRFVGRIYSDPAPWIRQMALEQFSEIGTSFLQAMAAAAPHVSADELAWRLRHVVAVVVNLFATYPPYGFTAAEAEATIVRLVGFLTPAMEAPPPAPAGR